MILIAVYALIPPTTLLIASAIIIPSVERIYGRKIVRGTTMITFLKREKKIAGPERPRDTNVYCPLIWNAMKMKPKKYSLIA